jgi:hypothetical protein
VPENLFHQRDDHPIRLPRSSADSQSKMGAACQDELVPILDEISDDITLARTGGRD